MLLRKLLMQKLKHLGLHFVMYNTSGVLKANLYNTDRIPTTGLTQGMYVVHMCVNDKKINGKFIVK